MSNANTDGIRHGAAVKDLVTAIGLLLFSIGGFLFINPEGSGIWPGPGGMTWRTLPFAYAAMLFVLSLVYVVQSLQKLRQERRIPKQPVDPAVAAEDRVILFRRCATIGLLLIYVSLLKVFGFAIVTPVFLFLLFRLYQRGNWRGDAFLSLIGGFVLWILFVHILKLNLKGTFLDPVTPFLLSVFKAIGL